MSGGVLTPVEQSTLTERMDYARALAHSGLLPEAYRNQPANVLFAVDYGVAIGVPPITAIMGINVIMGKPTLSADLMAALIRRAGHKLRIKVTGTKPADLVAVAELIRNDDPDFTYRTRWDMAKAQAAGLAGKDNWKKTPAAMLKARAISEVAREGASEVLHGLVYTAEELGATEVPDQDSDPATGHTEPDTVDAELVEDVPTKGMTVRTDDGVYDATTGQKLTDLPEEPEKAFPEQDTLT